MSAATLSRPRQGQPSLNESNSSLERRIRRFLVDRRFPTIKVQVTDEAVQLTGTASSIYERQILALSIGRLAGERQIQNEIEIEEIEISAPTARSIVEDYWYAGWDVAAKAPRTLLVAFAVLLLIPAVWAASSSSGNGTVNARVYPISGSVLVNGQPAAGAHIVLHPQGHQLPAGVVATATVGPDGAFQIGTFRQGDGAPAGEYVATISWNKLVNGQAGANVIPAQFATAKLSPVKVAVSSGKVQLAAIDIPLKNARAK